MPKFKIKKVSSFTYKGKRYVSGDIVELPERYETLDFTEPVVEEKGTKEKKPKE